MEATLFTGWVYDHLNPRDWQRLYAHPIYLVETFIDPVPFQATCYRAANWQVLGQTSGRGNNAPTLEPTRPVKPRCWVHHSNAGFASS